MTGSLTVLSGPLAGTRLDVDGSDDEILIGADPDCRLALDLPGVSPIHARLTQDQGELIVHDTRSPRGVYVNDTRVTGQARCGTATWCGWARRAKRGA
jgi:pSer/pThr/pTyr-binding forkhead associated (FHA) protein